MKHEDYEFFSVPADPPRHDADLYRIFGLKFTEVEFPYHWVPE